MKSPTCPACWGYHDLNLCCCNKELAVRKSAVTADTKLGTCPLSLCKAAVQKTGKLKWRYSCEAECLLYALPTPSDPAKNPEKDLCSGIDTNHVATLQPRAGSQHEPQAVLKMLEQLGDCLDPRPVFVAMFKESKNKLQFVRQVRPYLYVRTEAKTRASFCGGKALEGSSQCKPCASVQAMFSDADAMDST